MDKYQSISTMTQNYLNGKLVGLHMDYDSDKNVHILVSYKANDYFTLDYELEVNNKDKKVEFISHGSHNAFERVRLGREPEFDHAISEYLLR